MANGSGLVASFVFALMLAALPATAQTDFPKRHIHVVLPYPAGGIVDIATRIVTDKLSGLWRQPFVVEAKPAGSGNVAWDQVSRAAPDGYTWTFISPAVMANPRMFANLRWSDRSFMPVAALVMGALRAGRSSKPSGQHDGGVHRLRPRTSWSSQLGKPRHRHQSAPQHGNLPECDEARHGGRAVRGPTCRPSWTFAPIGFNSSSRRSGWSREHVSSGAVKPLAVLGTARSPLLPNVTDRKRSGLSRDQCRAMVRLRRSERHPAAGHRKDHGGLSTKCSRLRSSGAAGETGTAAGAADERWPAWRPLCGAHAEICQGHSRGRDQALGLI